MIASFCQSFNFWKSLKWISACILVLSHHPLWALFPDEKANGIYLGPEFYYLMRSRDGGTHQEGMILGGRLGYERIKRNCWYLGADVLYAEGKLEGDSSSGSKIKSYLTDTVIEGRLGYTFQHKYGLKAFITPFVGGGYFCETNDFSPPTPLLVKFTDSFKYFTVGALTGVQFPNQWNVGINFKAKWMVGGTCHVSNDPDFDDIELMMDDQFQYRIDLPIAYQFSKSCRRFEIGFIPFFEYRHFGGRENFPFDFIDTKFRLWGARVEFAYRF